MKYDVLNRFTGEVQFTAEIDCAEDAPPSVKLGLAVKWAVRNGANLAGANLVGATAVIDAGVPNGYCVVAYQYDNKLMLRAGCKTFSAAEAAEYWRDRSERAECVAALEYIKTVANLRGWSAAHD